MIKYFPTDAMTANFMNKKFQGDKFHIFKTMFEY